MGRLTSVLSVIALGLVVGGCSGNSSTNDEQDDGALFGSNSATEQQAPLKATEIDGYGAIAANDAYLFAVKTLGAGGGNEQSTVARVRHGETSPETLASFPGSVSFAAAVDDNLFVGVLSHGWQLLRIARGAAPAPIEAPQYLSALARSGKDLIVAGQKRDRGPDGGLMAMPAAGGPTRMLVPQADIDRVGGVGKHRVTGATITQLAIAGSDIVVCVQKTVDGSAGSGIVVAKVPASGGALQVLFDSDDSDIVLGAGVVGSNVWITRSLSHGDSASGELVQIALANGATKKVKAGVGAAVSTGDRLFFGEDGYVSSIAEPSTISVHARLGFPKTLVASPDGKRVYVNGNDVTTRLDR